MGPTIVRLNGIVITQGYDNFKQVDSEYYVPREAINLAHFEESDKTIQHKKYGTTHFYHIVVDGKSLENAAWYYGDKADEKIDEKADSKVSRWFTWPFCSNNGKAGEMKDWIGLRVTRRGDPGNPHHPLYAKPEGDGVTVEEDWFG